MISAYANLPDRRAAERKRHTIVQVHRANALRLAEKARQLRNTRDFEQEMRTALVAFATVAIVAALWSAMREE